jgi:hypothetical protein
MRSVTIANEAQLLDDVSRAGQARALLDNELLGSAFAALERSYLEAWRASHVDDCAAREKLFLAVNIVGKVRDQLARVVADGTLAQRELKQLADEIVRTAERKRRFGLG